MSLSHSQHVPVSAASQGWRSDGAWQPSLLDHIFSRNPTVPQSALCLGGRNWREQCINMPVVEPPEELVSQFSYIKL